VADHVAARFKEQTLIAADGVEIVAELPDGPVVVDERGG